MHAPRSSLTSLVAAIVLSVSSAASATDVEIRLGALSKQAIAGIPVVVDLALVNTTAAEVESFELDDPAIARIFWVWRTESGRSYEIRMRDYHFSAVPEPAFPKRIRIPPNGTVSRLHTVPTPLDFPGGETWTLTVRVRDPVDQGISTAEVAFEGRTLPTAETVVGSLSPGVAQAALLEYSRRDVLEQSVSGPVEDEIIAIAQTGAPLATLVALSRGLESQGDPTREWNALRTAPAEIRIVRTYLLLNEIERAVNRRQSVPPSWLRAARQVGASEPLGGAMQRALSPGRVGD